MTKEEWQALVEWMRSPEVRAAVARWAGPEADEPEGEPQQMVMEGI